MTTRAELSAAEEYHGHTPLMLAALDGNTEQVRELIRHGADINQRDDNGRTALMFAVINTHYETMKLLLEHGADVNAKSNQGGTALIGAALVLFAVLLAQRKQIAHDVEVLAVTTILHDLALAEGFDGPLRFEVEGANVAREFARKEGIDVCRAQLIWDGVALNSTPSISLYKEAEVALATMRIGLDWGGFGYEALTETDVVTTG